MVSVREYKRIKRLGKIWEFCSMTWSTVVWMSLSVSCRILCVKLKFAIVNVFVIVTYCPTEGGGNEMMRF